MILKHKSAGYYLSILLLLYSSCVMDSNNPQFDIKLKNMSKKEIIVYLKENYADTMLNIDDKGILLHGLTTPYFMYGSSFKANDSDVIAAIEYCDSEVWKNQVKKDTLLLFIFDRQKFEKTKNLNQSKLSMMYITYDYLMKNDCCIKYAD